VEHKQVDGRVEDAKEEREMVEWWWRSLRLEPCTKYFVEGLKDQRAS